MAWQAGVWPSGSVPSGTAQIRPASPPDADRQAAQSNGEAGRHPAQPPQSEAKAAQIIAQVASDNSIITSSAVSRLTRGMASSSENSVVDKPPHWRPSTETGYCETVSLFTELSLCDPTRSAAEARPCDCRRRRIGLHIAGRHRNRLSTNRQKRVFSPFLLRQSYSDSSALSRDDPVDPHRYFVKIGKILSIFCCRNAFIIVCVSHSVRRSPVQVFVIADIYTSEISGLSGQRQSARENRLLPSGAVFAIFALSLVLWTPLLLPAIRLLHDETTPTPWRREPVP